MKRDPYCSITVCNKTETININKEDAEREQLFHNTAYTHEDNKSKTNKIKTNPTR